MYQIRYEANPRQEDIQVLGNGIMDYARLRKNQPPIDFFAFFVRDADDGILGGCNGAIYYKCFYIDQLWLTEALRGKGLGTQLMQAADRLAREKDSLFATVNTMDWEALEFYKKFGFYVEHERRGYANNSTMYFLRKDY